MSRSCSLRVPDLFTPGADLHNLTAAAAAATDTSQSKASDTASPSRSEAATSVFQSPEKLSQLRFKRAWGLVRDSAFQLPVQFLLVWFTVNSVSLFQIVLLIGLLRSPILGVLNAPKLFSDIFRAPTTPQDTKQGSAPASNAAPAPVDNYLLPLTAYIFLQMLSLGFCLLKIHKLGLLPTSASDWLQAAMPLARTDALGPQGLVFGFGAGRS
ncbi:hypothetical protein H696_04618 [Fonticula alba]|uniref:ER membrane protein complex subunit 4 n=1 Tax=Fonticula alba TaxID=691883 RepID=A0A058Z4Z2_FONAL|nr:hypothetical protein H696_04618 [Fonticula alba]KCV69206.1 hypothetical protein H696_04618 [Fonticula alba]|eukprot:XP_009496777.1 hypothetical protein H696_04618 [Fonticula alba]